MNKVNVNGLMCVNENVLLLIGTGVFKIYNVLEYNFLFVITFVHHCTVYAVLVLYITWSIYKGSDQLDKFVLYKEVFVVTCILESYF